MDARPFFRAFAPLALGMSGGLSLAQPAPDPPSIRPRESPKIPAAAAAKSDVSVDDLLDQLEQMRREKSTSDEQERALLDRLRDRLRAQAEQLDRLGVALPRAGAKAPPNHAGAEQVRARAVALVRRLGSPEFADREAAEKALEDLGVAAADAVRAGTKDPDAEVARRCEALFKQVRAAELAAFEAGKADWPGRAGPKFREVVGESAAARKLFAAAVADDRLAGVLELATADPAKARRAYQTEARRLQEAGRAAYDSYAGRLAEADVWPAYRDEYRRRVRPGDLTAVLFLGALADLPLPDDPGRVDHALRATFIDLAGGPLKDPFRGLFAAWLSRRQNNEAVQAGLEAALYADVPDAAPAARRLAADPKAPAPVRAAALAVLGHHGRPADLGMLSACRDDWRRVTGGARVDGRVYEVQVRDVAAAMSLKLRGQAPETFGFSMTCWVGHWFGSDSPPVETVREFLTAAERDAAQSKAWEWLDRQPDAPPKPSK